MIRTLRALPTIMRVGFSEAIAYRAEMIVWVFSTSMPFVMLALWSSVAAHAPLAGTSGRSWGSAQFVAYFLAMFVVRQLVSCWAAWEMNFEVRAGTLSMRLLRPLHPVLAYAAGHIAAMPLRFAVSLPIVAGLAFSSASSQVTHDWRMWPLVLCSLIGGWMITFFANIAIGSLSLFMDSSLKVMDVWFTSFFVFSGYLFPTDLFPTWLKNVAQWLPFRFQVGLPVELVLGQHGVDEALGLLARQFGWAAGLFVVAMTMWNFGVRRFQAFGG